MKAAECRRAIGNSIEKVIDNLTEILSLLQGAEATALSEMQTLVFTKRRMISLMEHIQSIFKHLVQLKYLHRATAMEQPEAPSQPGLDDLFRAFK